MKIIKQGIKPEDMIFNAKCNQCGTEIEFAKKEATVTYDQREGNFMSITCPCCNHTITKNVPEIR